MAGVNRQSSTTQVLRTALQSDGRHCLIFCITSALISFVGAIVAISVFRAGYGCPLQNQGQLVGLGILTAIYMLVGVCMFISLLYWGFHYGHVAEIIAHNSAVALLAGVITILWGSVIFGVFMATITGDCFKVQETFQSTLAPLTLPSVGLNQTSNLVSDILT
ncbi:uncharacterized protein [Ptychodera flava]|uniref:uncharacterized protein n=1 Tax=Ptychodera flava TaxID=63121 RepID=UPI00396AB001